MSARDVFARKSSTFEIGGLSLTIRPLSLASRDRVRQFSTEHKDEPNRFAALVAVLGCDQFSEEDEQYLHEEADAAMVDKLSEAILKLSGMVPGATEEAEKN